MVKSSNTANYAKINKYKDMVNHYSLQYSLHSLIVKPTCIQCNWLLIKERNPTAPHLEGWDPIQKFKTHWIRIVIKLDKVIPFG